jgi:integrase
MAYNRGEAPKRAGKAKSATWEQARNRFKDFLLTSGKSPHTVLHYTNDLDKFARWFTASSKHALSPGTITDADLGKFADDLSREKLTTRNGKPLRDGRPRKAATVNAKMAALQSFLRWAKRQGLIAAIPESPDRRPLGRKEVKWLDRNQQNDLLRAAARDRWRRNYAIVVILIEMGLRVAELIALRWFDLELMERKGWMTVREGKGRKPRRLPLTVAAFKQFKALQTAEGNPPAADQVFRSQIKDKARPGEQQPLSIRGVQQILGKYAKELGWKKLTPHQLRHTCAINMRDRKPVPVPWPVISAWLGHTSVKTTLDHYATTSDRDLEAAAGVDFDEV